MARIALALALAAFAGPAAFADDGALFTKDCSACHGKGGIGTPNLAPPLAKADWGKASKPEMRAYVPTVMLNGLSGKLTAGGRSYDSVMPPQSQRSDEDLAALANYVLTTLNSAPADFKPLTAADIAALRPTKIEHSSLLELRARLMQ